MSMSLSSLAEIEKGSDFQIPKDRKTINALDYQSMTSYNKYGGAHALLLKKWAFFSTTDLCEDSCNGLVCRIIGSNIIQISLILYHLFRFGLAIYTYQSTCIPFQLNILLGKLSTMLIYIFGLITLRQDKLWKYIKKSYNPITNSRWLILIIAISVPYVTGIIVACTVDYQKRETWDFVWHLLIESSDVLRYWPSSAVVLIFYGFMDTFSFEIEVKEQSVSDDDDEQKSPDRNNDKWKIWEFENFDHLEFMKMFGKATRKYRIVVDKFSAFIIVFFVDVLLLWGSIFVSVIFDFYGTDCEYENIEYIHYFAETMFYCLLWTVMIYKLHICHGKLSTYKNDFEVKVGITKPENAVQKVLIHNYLDVISENRSPFAFFGINPDTRTIVIVFSSVLLPLTTQTLHYIYNYDIV